MDASSGTFPVLPQWLPAPSPADDGSTHAGERSGGGPGTGGEGAAWKGTPAGPSARRLQWKLLVDGIPLLHAYVRRLVGNRERANEVIQEVSLRILAGSAPSEPERFAAWSRGVARHVIAHDWRMRRRAQAELSLDEGLVEEIFDPHADPEGHLDARVSLARLVDDIDPDGLELLFRRYVLEETGKELADELSQSPAALRMRLMRLRTTASGRRG